MKKCVIISGSIPMIQMCSSQHRVLHNNTHTS